MAKKQDDAFDQAYSRGAKVKRFFTIIVFILTVITCIQLFFIHDSKQFNRQVFSLIQYVAFFLILNSPKLLKKYHLEVPVEVYIVVTIFAFLGLVLGDGLNFYGRIHWWDSLLHFASGVILSFIAMWMIQMLIGRHERHQLLDTVLIYIFVASFSLAAGAFWELCEYTTDDLFKTNNQKYMASTRGTIITKNDVPLVGHAALTDTMKDLALDLGGALVVIAYECSKKGLQKKLKEKKSQETSKKNG